MNNIYDRKFIFELLGHQIRTRIKWHSPDSNPYETAANAFWDYITEDGIMHLNKVKMPDIRGYGSHVQPNAWYVWPTLYAESIMIHHLFDDDYSMKNYDMIDNLGAEEKWSIGPYCLENVTVEDGDVVIDGGAYIGDWSAVAAQMGGEVYAFEPSPTFRNILEKCAELNNFHTVPKGLGDKTCQKKIIIDTYPYTERIDENSGIPCDIVSIDDFARENDLHINFIKSDIEGYERYMIAGAKQTLRTDQPKLSLCTYHNNREDETVLPQMIRDINPNYKIIAKKMKLYAWVDKC